MNEKARVVVAGEAISFVSLMSMSMGTLRQLATKLLIVIPRFSFSSLLVVIFYIGLIQVIIL